METSTTPKFKSTLEVQLGSEFDEYRFPDFKGQINNCPVSFTSESNDVHNDIYYYRVKYQFKTASDKVSEIQEQIQWLIQHHIIPFMENKISRISGDDAYYDYVPDMISSFIRFMQIIHYTGNQAQELNKSFPLLPKVFIKEMVSELITFCNDNDYGLDAENPCTDLFDALYDGKILVDSEDNIKFI